MYGIIFHCSVVAGHHPLVHILCLQQFINFIPSQTETQHQTTLLVGVDFSPLKLLWFHLSARSSLCALGARFI